MAKFKCWLPECGETEDSAIPHCSDYPELAAESHVRDYEQRTREFTVGSGNELLTVQVRRLDDRVLFEVLVGGVAMPPTYNGRIIKTITKV